MSGRNERSPVKGIDTFYFSDSFSRKRSVEMKEARLRALTLEYNSSTIRLRISRNERSPVKGIDTLQNFVVAP